MLIISLLFYVIAGRGNDAYYCRITNPTQMEYSKMLDLLFVAENRTDLGKGASRRLRRTGNIPAIIYGGTQAPISITLNHNEVLKQFRTDNVYSQILSVQINGKIEMAILRDVQRHPYKPLITHLDFFRVNAKEEIVMSVPLVFENAELCKGVKLQGGQITHLITTIEISCFPKDLPASIAVDLLNLELGATLHLSEIVLPNGVVLVAPAHGHDEPVVSVIHTRSEETNEVSTPAE